MISLSMNEAQFEEAKKILSAKFSEEQQHESLVVTDDLHGHVHTIQIDADYTYVVEAQTLVFTNESKHGLYKFVSDATIGTALKKQLGNIQVTETLNTEATSGNEVAQTLVEPEAKVEEQV